MSPGGRLTSSSNSTFRPGYTFLSFQIPIDRSLLLLNPCDIGRTEPWLVALLLLLLPLLLILQKFVVSNQSITYIYYFCFSSSSFFWYSLTIDFFTYIESSSPSQVVPNSSCTYSDQCQRTPQ